MLDVVSMERIKREGTKTSKPKSKVQVLEINKESCEKVRKSKTDNTFFGDIPYVKGKPYYKINKNANPDFVFYVSKMIQRVAAEEKMKC